MSGPEAKNPAPAGISSPEEIDVAALFDRLREELRRGAVHEDSRGAEFASTRALAERFWPVTAERPPGGGPPSAAAREQAERLVRELEERLARLERRGGAAGPGGAPVPATVAAQPAAASVPDYFAFESRMRGSVDSIRERQRL